jgi:hypothetical protein
MLVALEDGLLVVRIKSSVPHSSVATEFVLVVAELWVGEIVRRDMSPPWFFLDLGGAIARVYGRRLVDGAVSV